MAHFSNQSCAPTTRRIVFTRPGPKADIVELAKLLRQWQAQAGQVKLDKKSESGDHAPWTDTRSHLARTGSLQRSGSCSRATSRCGSGAAPLTSWLLWSNAPARWSAKSN